MKWFQKAADQGYAEAQYNLGCCLLFGNGVEKDETEAVKWFQKAAQQEYAEAQHYLGYCLFSGTGVEKDETEAVTWFRKAAVQGNAEAQYDLGYCLASGTGVEKDETEAVTWFQKAAQQGYAEAQHYLGYCLFSGTGVEKDETEAVTWFRKAAVQGNAEAQYDLGYCLASGTGVEKNQEEAMLWLHKAADQGNENAKQALRQRKFSFIRSWLIYFLIFLAILGFCYNKLNYYESYLCPKPTEVVLLDKKYPLQITCRGTWDMNYRWKQNHYGSPYDFTISAESASEKTEFTVEEFHILHAGGECRIPESQLTKGISSESGKTLFMIADIALDLSLSAEIVYQLKIRVDGKQYQVSLNAAMDRRKEKLNKLITRAW